MKLFKHKLKAVLISAVLAGSINTQVKALVVFDPTNFATNLNQYISFIEDALIQLEHLDLMDNQLITDIESLITQYAALEQMLLAAQQLDDLTGYIEDRDIKQAYQSTMSILRRIQILDPQSPNYTANRDEVLNSRYQWEAAIIPYEEFVGAINPSGISSEITGYQAILSNHDLTEQYKDKINLMTENFGYSSQLTRHRVSTINQYQRELGQLQSVENLQLATIQVTAKQGNLLLQQQEEIISRLERQEQREIEKQVQQIEALNELNDRFNARILRKANRQWTLEAGDALNLYP